MNIRKLSMIWRAIIEVEGTKGYTRRKVFKVITKRVGRGTGTTWDREDIIVKWSFKSIGSRDDKLWPKNGEIPFAKLLFVFIRWYVLFRIWCIECGNSTQLESTDFLVFFKNDPVSESSTHVYILRIWLWHDNCSNVIS